MERKRSIRVTAYQQIVKRVLGVLLLLSLAIIRVQSQDDSQYKIVDYRLFYEAVRNARDNHTGSEPHFEDGMYLKDVSGVLSALEGTWIGTFDKYIYVFVMHKATIVATQRKTKRDNIWVKYRVYERDKFGSLSVAQSSEHSPRNTCYIQGYSYNPKGETMHVLIYKGYDFDQTGFLLLWGSDWNKKKITLTEYSEMLPAFDTPQLFPITDKRLNRKESAEIRRVSRNQLMPPRPSTDNLKIQENSQVLPTMEQLQLYGSYVLGDRSYTGAFNFDLWGKLWYEDINKYTIAYKDIPEKWRHRGSEDRVHLTAYEVVCGPSFVSIDSAKYTLQITKKGVYSTHKDLSYLQAECYKLLVQASMIDYVIHVPGLIRRKDWWRYERDWDKLLYAYASQRHISISSLKQHILDDAHTVFYSGYYTHPEKIMQSLKDILASQNSDTCQY